MATTRDHLPAGQVPNPEAGGDVLAGDLAVEVADLFGMLGDPHRVRLLFALRSADELSVGELAERVRMSSSAVSHALRLLRTAGIISNRRVGRSVRYRLSDAHVRVLLDVVGEHVEHDREPTRSGS